MNNFKTWRKLTLFGLLLSVAFVFYLFLRPLFAIGGEESPHPPENLSYQFWQTEGDKAVVKVKWDSPNIAPVGEEFERPQPELPASDYGYKATIVEGGKEEKIIINPYPNGADPLNTGGYLDYETKLNSQSLVRLRSFDRAGNESAEVSLNIETSLPEISNIKTECQNNNVVITFNTKTESEPTIAYSKNEASLQDPDYNANPDNKFFYVDGFLKRHRLAIPKDEIGYFVIFVIDKSGNNKRSEIKSTNGVCNPLASPTASLQGKVYDRNGHWIAGAKVEVLDKKAAAAITVKDPRQVNYPAGVNYVIPEIPLKEAGKEEEVKVRASIDGCPTSELSVTLKPYDKTKREIITVRDFQLLCDKPTETTKPSNNQISGTITDNNNQPLANAEITIDLPAPIPDLHAVTDSNGHYSIVVPDAVQSATNITVTANHSSSSSLRLRTVTYGGSSLQADFQLIPKTTRANENTSPNITKLIYQKTVSKNKTILNFNYQAEDKEDKSSKLKYSYRINNGKWHKWTKKTKVKYDIAKYQGKTVQFELRARDGKKKEGRGQRVEVRRQ